MRLAALILAFLLAALPARAAEEAAALATTEALVTEANAALNEVERPADVRMGELRTAIDRAFAFDVWRRFLLEPLEGKLSDAEQAEVETLLPGFLAHLYRTNFERGLDEVPTIGEVKPARRDLLVRVTYPRANGDVLPTDWRIRDFGDRGHLVIDVMVGGASFLRLKRDEFAAIVQQGGGAALVAHLRENNV